MPVNEKDWSVTVYGCDKCNHLLFTKLHLFSNEKQDSEHWVIEPMSWMSLGQSSGMLSCVSCHEELGQFYMSNLSPTGQVLLHHFRELTCA